MLLQILAEYQLAARVQRVADIDALLFVASDKIGIDRPIVGGALLDQFLHAMASNDGQQGQRWERVSGRGASAMLHVPGGAPISVAIQDISRSGTALRSAWTGEVGAPVELALARSGARIAARVVRHGGGVVALTFRQDDRTMADIDGIVAHRARDGAVREAA